MSEPRRNWSSLIDATPSVGERLLTGLEAMIVSGELEAGSRLPPERELAEQLNVSRASLRQALHDLEVRGLIDRRPGRGTIVSDPHRSELSEPMLRLMSSEERTIAEVMDLRAAIEPPVAARAAARATPSDVAALFRLLHELEAEVDLDRAVELDVRFHVLIGRSTHNPLLARLMETASEWVGPSRSGAMLTKARRDASNAAHRAIAEAIGNHDSEAAAAAMAGHVSTVARHLGGEVAPPVPSEG
jgi:GntR family transcriptional repressor for pyruvate dehydrogenase complex